MLLHILIWSFKSVVQKEKKDIYFVLNWDMYSEFEF